MEIQYHYDITFLSFSMYRAYQSEMTHYNVTYTCNKKEVMAIQPVNALFYFISALDAIF